MTHIKKCFSIPTTHGLTYCETYEPFRTTAGNESVNETVKSAPQVILMVHGCGGSVDHFSQSGIPQLLADQGNTVVCFDWYSHGKSARISSKDVRHNLEFFFSQLNDIIQSPDLPVRNSKFFVAHGFSMGCYILLQYCVRYKPFWHATPTGASAGVSPLSKATVVEKVEATHQNGPFINKIVLQSPWDGNVPSFLRCLIRVPLLLRMFKPSDMSGIKSIGTLKQLLLELDRDIDYKQSMEEFADALIACTTGDDTTSSASSNKETTEGPVQVDNVTVSTSSKKEPPNVSIACSVLMIAGTRELPFHITARRITKRLQRKHAAHTTAAATATATEASGKVEQVVESPVAHFQFKTCKYAGHMSFAKHGEDSYVRKFFHKEISDFIAQKSVHSI